MTIAEIKEDAMKKLLALLVVAVFVSVPVYASSIQPEPDVIYYNAKIVTLDANGSMAGAVAVKDGKIRRHLSIAVIRKPFPSKRRWNT